APSHRPTIPPSETPQNAARSTPSSSRISRTPRAIVSIETGPSGGCEWPWPGWSWRTMRKCVANTGSWAVQSEVVVPSAGESTSTGDPGMPSTVYESFTACILHRSAPECTGTRREAGSVGAGGPRVDRGESEHDQAVEDLPHGLARVQNRQQRVEQGQDQRA